MNAAPSVVLRHASGWAIAGAIGLIVLGVFAMALPWATSFAFAMIVGWLLIFSAAIQIVHAFQLKGIGHLLWKLAVALLYLAVGCYFLVYPLMGLAAIALALAFFFLAEGLMDVAEFFQNRKLAGSGWILLDGIVTLLLGLMIAKHWPASSLWAFGILVGVSMVMTGLARLMVTLAARKIVEHFAA